MKIVFAIVNSADSNKVIEELTVSGYPVVKLGAEKSLLSGNTTLLIYADDNRVDDIISIIKSKFGNKKQIYPKLMTHEEHRNNITSHAPDEVTIGGAKIFVTDVSRYEEL